MLIICVQSVYNQNHTTYVIHIQTKKEKESQVARIFDAQQIENRPEHHFAKTKKRQGQIVNRLICSPKTEEYKKPCFPRFFRAESVLFPPIFWSARRKSAAGRAASPFPFPKRFAKERWIAIACAVRVMPSSKNI